MILVAQASPQRQGDEPSPEIELVEMELGVDSVLGRERPLAPKVEGRDDDSVELIPGDPIPLPIVLGRFMDPPIVDPGVLPSGEILLGLLPIDPVIAVVEPRLDDVDPRVVDDPNGDVASVDPVVPMLPNLLPDMVPGGQLRMDEVDVDPSGLATPVGLVGLVVDPAGPVTVPVPVGLGGPMGPDNGPPTGPGVLVV